MIANELTVYRQYSVSSLPKVVPGNARRASGLRGLGGSGRVGDGHLVEADVRLAESRGQTYLREDDHLRALGVLRLLDRLHGDDEVGQVDPLRLAGVLLVEVVVDRRRESHELVARVLGRGPTDTNAKSSHGLLLT